MMSMSFRSDTLNSPDPSKSAFLEFGHGLPTSQQHLPGFTHNIYPVHGLRSSGHLQHDGPFPSSASHYSRPLGYAYPGPVSAAAPSPYMPYQQNNHSRTEDNSEYNEKVKMITLMIVFYIKHICSDIPDHVYCSCFVMLFIDILIHECFFSVHSSMSRLLIAQCIRTARLVKKEHVCSLF